MNFQQHLQTLQFQRCACGVRHSAGGIACEILGQHTQQESCATARMLPVAQPMAQTAARQWPSMVDTVDAGELSPEAECPYQATRSPAHQGRAFPDLNAATAVAHSPAHQGHGSIHTPTIKQSPSMLIFPHQQAEKSLHNQHDLSILIVGLNQLKHRLSRTNTSKSHPSSNT